MDCREISSLRSPYIDGELDEATKGEFEAHIGSCPPCRVSLESLNAAVRTVRTRFAPERTPVYLRERIREEIGRRHPNVWARPGEWLRSFRLGPLPSLSLAGATIAAVIVAISLAAGEGAAGAEVTLSGRVACLDCTLNAKYGAHNECAKYGHRNGFLRSDGTLWTFMNDDVWHPYFNDQRLCGRSIVLRGRQYPEAHYIELASYEFIGDIAARPREAPSIGMTASLPREVDAVAYRTPH